MKVGYLKMKKILLMVVLTTILLSKNIQNEYIIIKEDLDQSIKLYEIQDIVLAVENIKFSRHHGFRNSGLEEKIKIGISNEYAQDISDHFEKIIFLMKNSKDIEKINNLRNEILQKIKIALSKLKPMKEEPKLQKNWQKVINEILYNLKIANKLYENQNIKPSIEKVYKTYFDVFEDSGFEKAILDISIDRKVKAEERFRLMVNMMKRGNNSIEIESLIEKIEDDLNELSNMINPKPKKDNISIYIFILLVLIFLSTLTIYTIKRKK